jgi:hypothetical protein
MFGSVMDACKTYLTEQPRFTAYPGLKKVETVLVSKEACEDIHPDALVSGAVSR